MNETGRTSNAKNSSSVSSFAACTASSRARKAASCSAVKAGVGASAFSLASNLAVVDTKFSSATSLVACIIRYREYDFSSVTLSALAAQA